MGSIHLPKDHRMVVFPVSAHGVRPNSHDHPQLKQSEREINYEKDKESTPKTEPQNDQKPEYTGSPTYAKNTCVTSKANYHH